MDSPLTTKRLMEWKGPEHIDSIQEHNTPKFRDTFTARTFKRRSNVENVQRTIQLLDDAVSPSMNTFNRTPRAGNLRHSSYTPAASESHSRLDTNELFTFPSARKQNLLDESMGSIHDPVMSRYAHRVQPNETMSPFNSMMAVDFTEDDGTFLTDEDHSEKVSLELYEAFMKKLKSCSASPQVLDLLPEYTAVCDKYVSILAKVGKRVTKNQLKFQKATNLQDLLREEKHTWQLVYSLYKDRLEEEAKAEMDESMDVNVAKLMVWSLSEKNISNKLFEKDASVRQSQLVVDWLEMCSYESLGDLADNALFFKDEPVAWENTLHHLQKIKKRTFLADNDKTIVSEMDPDAPVRQQRSLDNVDESDERRLLRNLFTLLRAGQLDTASELCQSYGQPWRAASLEGWRLLHDPNYVEPAGEDGKANFVEGNFYRDVWKVVCWRMAKEPGLDQYERAMYASLSGNLQSLLPVCVSWMDYLWAYFKVMVDIRVEQEIRLYKKTDRELDDLPPEFYDSLLEPDEIFVEIEASTDETVSLQAKTWYHVIQKYIILGDISGLIVQMYSWLQSSRKFLPAHLLRLMAHLVLFLRSIGHSCKEDLCEAIIKSYVEDLINSGTNKNIIAFYVATLSPMAQIQWYSMFLEGITDQDERRQCLVWAEAEGLNIAAITKMVVETIRNRDSPSEVPTDSLVPDLTISEDDAAKIHAIDWLVFDENHRPEAIKQANSLLRCFIVLKKYAAARHVFNKLPSDTIDVIYKLWRVKTGSSELPDNDSNAIREYLCMKVYLDAVESFNDWFVLYHQGQPVKPSGEEGGSFADRVAMEHKMKQYQLDYDRWLHNLQVQTKTSRDRIYNVLLFPDGGWLVDTGEDPDADDLRLHQMKQLRQIHLPALCLNLHTILHSSKMYEEAVQIGDVVASEVHQLYTVFDKESLQHLLSQIWKSSLSLLNAGKDPFGYEIV